VEHLRHAIGLAFRAGDRELLCDAYIELATAHTREGHVPLAVAELQEGVDVLTFGEGLRSGLGPPRLLLLGLRLAELHLRRGACFLARRTAEDALERARRAGAPVREGRLHALLASILDEEGDLWGALEHRTEALEKLRAIGDRWSTAELLVAHARASGEVPAWRPPARGAGLAGEHPGGARPGPPARRRGPRLARARRGGAGRVGRPLRHATPVSPSARLGRPLPPSFEEPVLACLARDPADRPESAAALVGRPGAREREHPWSAADARAWWATHGEALRARRRRAPELGMASTLQVARKFLEGETEEAAGAVDRATGGRARR